VCTGLEQSAGDAEDDDGDDYRNSNRNKVIWFSSIDMGFLALPTFHFCLKIFLTLQIIFLSLSFFFLRF
jgi:hypothetical protein